MSSTSNKNNLKRQSEINSENYRIDNNEAVKTMVVSKTDHPNDFKENNLVSLNDNKKVLIRIAESPKTLKSPSIFEASEEKIEVDKKSLFDSNGEDSINLGKTPLGGESSGSNIDVDINDSVDSNEEEENKSQNILVITPFL